MIGVSGFRFKVDGLVMLALRTLARTFRTFRVRRFLVIVAALELILDVLDGIARLTEEVHREECWRGSKPKAGSTKRSDNGHVRVDRYMGFCRLLLGEGKRRKEKRDR